MGFKKNPFLKSGKKKKRAKPPEDPAKPRVVKPYCPALMVRYDKRADSNDEYKSMWVCKMCATCVLTEKSTREHLKRCTVAFKNSIAAKTPEKPIEETRYICRICNQCFSRRVTLLKHSEKHRPKSDSELCDSDNEVVEPTKVPKQNVSTSKKLFKKKKRKALASASKSSIDSKQIVSASESFTDSHLVPSTSKSSLDSEQIASTSKSYTDYDQIPSTSRSYTNFDQTPSTSKCDQTPSTSKCDQTPSTSKCDQTPSTSKCDQTPSTSKCDQIESTSICDKIETKLKSLKRRKPKASKSKSLKIHKPNPSTSTLVLKPEKNNDNTCDPESNNVFVVPDIPISPTSHNPIESTSTSPMDVNTPEVSELNANDENTDEHELC